MNCCHEKIENKSKQLSISAVFNLLCFISLCRRIGIKISRCQVLLVVYLALQACLIAKSFPSDHRNNEGCLFTAGANL